MWVYDMYEYIEILEIIFIVYLKKTIYTGYSI